MFQKRSGYVWCVFAWTTLSLLTIHWIVLALWLLVLPLSMIASRETQPLQRRRYCAYAIIIASSIKIAWDIMLWYYGALAWYMLLMANYFALDFIVSSIQILRKVK